MSVMAFVAGVAVGYVACSLLMRSSPLEDSDSWKNYRERLKRAQKVPDP